MLSTVLSSAVFGIDAYRVEIEVDIANGLPAFNIVGLPDTACRESSDRVRSAIKNSGYSFPSRKITVNLAPADIKKEGSAFDLAIAIGILVAEEELDPVCVNGKIFCGELALDGKVRGVPGILPRAASLLEERTSYELVVPAVNANEARCVKGITAHAVSTLLETVLFLKGEAILPEVAPSAECDPVSQNTRKTRPRKSQIDFAEIKGQSQAKRGLEIAAAGGHNILLIGPPGSGKTMLAKRLPTILSTLTFDEAIETTKIHSVAGLLPKKKALVEDRPFRDPHHTISDMALIGGGKHPKPGEVSLAHNGVLFLDELAEFRKNALEVLRQPLEDGRVTISRVSSSVTLPARFMMVAAMNPCPCGYFTDPKKECHCSPIQIKNYMTKLSGPLLDRIDIQLEVPCLKVDEITAKTPSEKSSVIRERVERARVIQRKRYEKEGVLQNAELEPRLAEAYCQVSGEAEALLKMAIENLGFSARAYHKVLKVSRTIADLEASPTVEAAHVSEAVHYRALDRNLWLR